MKIDVFFWWATRLARSSTYSEGRPRGLFRIRSQILSCFSETITTTENRWKWAGKCRNRKAQWAVKIRSRVNLRSMGRQSILINALSSSNSCQCNKKDASQFDYTSGYSFQSSLDLILAYTRVLFSDICACQTRHLDVSTQTPTCSRLSTTFQSYYARTLSPNNSWTQAYESLWS